MIRTTFLFIILMSTYACHNSQVDQVINGRTYSKTMLELDKYNTDSNMVIYETPTYYKLEDDSTITNELKEKREYYDIDPFSADSFRYAFSKDSLLITELIFVHGDYGFVPAYRKTDTSLHITRRSIVIADTAIYKEKKELYSIDVTVAFWGDLITRLAIDSSDRSKSIYYRNKKIK